MKTESHIVKATGLCKKCLYAENCVIRHSYHGHIFQCEEFEDHETEETAASDESDSLLGLCMSCDKAPVCTLPKPPGGVWQCNEYE